MRQCYILAVWGYHVYHVWTNQQYANSSTSFLIMFIYSIFNHGSKTYDLLNLLYLPGHSLPATTILMLTRRQISTVRHTMEQNLGNRMWSPGEKNHSGSQTWFSGKSAVYIYIWSTHLYMVFPATNLRGFPSLVISSGRGGWLILAEFSPHPINQVMVTMSDVYDVYDICDDFDDYSTVYCLNLYKHEMYDHIR